MQHKIKHTQPAQPWDITNHNKQIIQLTDTHLTHTLFYNNRSDSNHSGRGEAVQSPPHQEQGRVHRHHEQSRSRLPQENRWVLYTHLHPEIERIIKLLQWNQLAKDHSHIGYYNFRWEYPKSHFLFLFFRCFTACQQGVWPAWSPWGTGCKV